MLYRGAFISNKGLLDLYSGLDLFTNRYAGYKLKKGNKYIKLKIWERYWLSDGRSERKVLVEG